MARPTTWRRSFNYGGFHLDQESLDLLTVSPGETLGATWWQYSLRSIGAPLANDNPPMDNAIVVAGLILVEAGSDPVYPLFAPFGPWLWWEMVTFDHVLVNPIINFAYLNVSNTGGTQRKIQAMRKNDTSNDMTLRFAYQAFPGSATAAEVAFASQVACSALIILP